MLLYKWYSSNIEKGLQNYTLSWGKGSNSLKNCHTSFSCYKFWLWAQINSFLNITYGIKWITSLGSSDLLQLWRTSSHLKHSYHYILIHLGITYSVFCWKHFVENVLEVYLYFEKVRKKKVELINSSQINILWSKQNP